MDGLARLTDALDPDERAALEARLWALLERQSARYTQGDHGTLRVETAEALFESLCLTLDALLQAENLPARALLSRDLDAALSAGQRLLESAMDEARRLYEAVQRTAPAFANRGLRDTLRGIQPFFARYDLRFRAQELPADIDYPLCRPVPEELRGVWYLRAYLQRLLIENALLARAEPARERALLTRYYGAYEEPLVNLAEPVAACAVGLTLIGGAPETLAYTPDERERLRDALRPLPRAEREQALRSSAERLCMRWNLPPEAQTYWSAFAASLSPRAGAAEALAGVFAC